MRCQWWQSAVNDLYKGHAPDHPVMTALAEVLQQAQLTRYRLQRIVASREEVSGLGQQPESLAELLAQLDSSLGQLSQLQLEAAHDASPTSAEAAQKVARGVGLARVLRGTPRDASRGRTRLPEESTGRHGVSLSGLAQGRPSPELCAVAAELAGVAKGNLAEARKMTADVPQASRPLLLPALHASLWLDRLAAVGHDVFNPALQISPVSPLGYQLRLKWAMLRHRF
ncbi:NADH dehydrogenase (ubiquinone) complex I, assembly factor 6 [Auxenochlorella protothecoides]|nr:NADH dehydrogenase (ubiquinone) complex I, assembly factor 6 [Auxenochlorella protothecoides]KFM28202.1 NADH dehydrogenase (ubiquinone) complex I, assembly factor 6 [Auxenochlorella protothecoides]RMZ56419.1 hypothetical protein APUTEX25_004642 [Auxenochlorella protothecoides]|eukprot:RMZ56419.1 hypothetical protein APUTEX25_004642 [Auxenochlorella protothecoides]